MDCRYFYDIVDEVFELTKKSEFSGGTLEGHLNKDYAWFVDFIRQSRQCSSATEFANLAERFGIGFRSIDELTSVFNLLIDASNDYAELTDFRELSDHALESVTGGAVSAIIVIIASLIAGGVGTAGGYMGTKYLRSKNK